MRICWGVGEYPYSTRSITMSSFIPFQECQDKIYACVYSWKNFMPLKDICTLLPCHLGLAVLLVAALVHSRDYVIIINKFTSIHSCFGNWLQISYRKSQTKHINVNKTFIFYFIFISFHGSINFGSW